MPQDMNSMREAAIRRAREMHSRAMPNFEEPINPIQNEIPNVPQNIPNNNAQHNHEQPISEDLLQSFFHDKERMLIIALMVILSKEEGNNSLLFALMYLLI